MRSNLTSGDPLLHTHVVTANMTTPATSGLDEAWRAIPGAGLYEHARAAGHLYKAHLRHLLATRLGVEFCPVIKGYAEVVDVPDAVVRVFSKRRHEIEEVLAESGNQSARAAQVATLETRKAKSYEVDRDVLEQQWRTEANGAGFGPDEAAACFGRAVSAVPDADFERDLFDALAGPRGLTERSSTFGRTEVIEMIASAMGSQASAATIEWLADRFLAPGHALLVDRTPMGQTAEEASSSEAEAYFGLVEAPRRSYTQRTYTTPDLARLEALLLTWGQPDDAVAASVAGETVDTILDRSPELSTEQRAMITATCTAGEFLQPIAGRPGAGKTYATEAVVAGHVAAGIPILGCAVSAAAAAELEHAAGFARSTGHEASTVARLLLDLDDPQGGGLLPGTVIVVDEASMLGTRDLARLATAARQAGGALRLIGDPDQHGAVDVGGVFRRLCADRGSTLVRLVDNNRQQDHTERLAITDYREGRIADALARYDDAEKVIRSATAGESFDAMVADWYAARLHGEHDPMIAGPNSLRRALNDRARVLLKTHGELSGPALVTGGREFMVGDEVVARRNDRTLRAAGSRDFVKNGSTGTIRHVDLDNGEVVVDFEREGTVRLPRRYLVAGRLDHAYARTTYGVQGATHTTARYHPSDVSSFEEGYVALTRARLGARIYIVDGTLPAEDELRHAPDDPQPQGIAEITHALARRRAGHMAADASPDLAALAGTLTTMSLEQLTRRRRQLDHALASGPADPTRTIEHTTAALDRIRAQTLAWQALLDQQGHPAGRAPARTADRDDTTQRARAAIRALARATAELTARLDHAYGQHADRDAWRADHADLSTSTASSGVPSARARPRSEPSPPTRSAPISPA
jgi:hypothetical protein